eukprot:603082-Alexandrium_andersonii.AAC.1
MARLGLHDVGHEHEGNVGVSGLHHLLLGVDVVHEGVHGLGIAVSGADVGIRANGGLRVEVRSSDE